MGDITVNAAGQVNITEGNQTINNGAVTNTVSTADQRQLLVQISQLQEALASLSKSKDIQSPLTDLQSSVKALKAELDQSKTVSKSLVSKFKKGMELVTTTAKGITNTHEVIPVLAYYGKPLIEAFERWVD